MAEKASSAAFIAWPETPCNIDVGRVGGKNASLGEMVHPIAETRGATEIKLVHAMGGSARTATLQTHLDAAEGAGP